MPFQKKVPFKENKRFDKKTQDAPFLVDFSPPGRQNAYFFQRKSPHTDSMFPPKKVKKRKKKRNLWMRACAPAAGLVYRWAVLADPRPKTAAAQKNKKNKK